MAVQFSENLPAVAVSCPSRETILVSSSSAGSLKYICLLLTIVSAEVALYYRVSDGAAIMRHGASLELQATLAITTAELRDLITACAAAIVIFSWSGFSALVKLAIAGSASDSEGNRSPFVHLLISSLLIGWASIDPLHISSPASAIAWNLGRLVLFIAATGSILVAIIPSRLWLRWYFSNRAGVAVGAAFGFAIWIAKFLVRSVWWSTDRATLYGSYLILRLLGQHPVVH